MSTVAEYFTAAKNRVLGAFKVNNYTGANWAPFLRFFSSSYNKSMVVYNNSLKPIGTEFPVVPCEETAFSALKYAFNSLSNKPATCQATQVQTALGSALHDGGLYGTVGWGGLLNIATIASDLLTRGLTGKGLIERLEDTEFFKNIRFIDDKTKYLRWALTLILGIVFLTKGYNQMADNANDAPLSTDHCESFFKDLGEGMFDMVDLSECAAAVKVLFTTTGLAFMWYVTSLSYGISKGLSVFSGAVMSLGQACFDKMKRPEAWDQEQVTLHQLQKQIDFPSTRTGHQLLPT